MKDVKTEVLTLSKLGFSAHGIVDLTGAPLKLVRAILAAAHPGGRGVRKCSTPSEPVDRRLAGAAWAPWHDPYSIPHAGDRSDTHGLVRVYRLPKG